MRRNFRGVGERLRRAAARVRAGEWWDHKFAPIFAIFYASAFRDGEAVAPHWSALLLLLASAIPGAIYVSLINDWSDLSDDAAAGKRNRLTGVPKHLIAIAVVACLLAGAAFCWHWRHDPLLVGVYLGPWIAFTLYSLPPLRWKSRGFLGLVADSAGAHAFPAMLAVVLFASSAHRPVDMAWLGAAGLWAFAYGLRGILWHQLLDAAADRRAAVRTFVYLHGETRAVSLVTRAVAPVELLALALLLVQLDSFFPVAALALYWLSSALRVHWHGLSPTLVAHRERPLLVGKDYYDLFFPLALLAASALRHPLDALVLLAHLACFPGRTNYLLAQIGDARNRWRAWRYSPT